jgi:hypothetical protein
MSEEKLSWTEVETKSEAKPEVFTLWAQGFGPAGKGEVHVSLAVSYSKSDLEEVKSKLGILLGGQVEDPNLLLKITAESEFAS